MRPQRLSLSAFGPFAAEQVFDFAALGAHRLFLIHGPTGAGKTTLLDALCFALFGCSSGDERQPAHLRSQHADPSTPTWVELDFAIGATGYRIRRRPVQPAVGRGGRIVTQPPKVELWRRDQPALELLAEQDRSVRPAIEALLGYAEDEFRQVVVLPQGRFREVLTAPPGARQAILATLFRTSLYRRIEEQIAARAKTALEQATMAQTRRVTLLGEAGATSPEQAQAIAAALEAQSSDAERERQALALAASSAAFDLTQARHVAGLLEQADKTAAGLATLRTRQPAIDADRTRLDAARRADTTLAAELLHGQLAAQAHETASEARAAATALREATVRLQRAQEALGDEVDRRAAIVAGQGEAERLARSASAAALAETAETRAAKAEQALTRARSARSNAERASQAARVALEAAVRVHDEAARRADAAPALQAAHERAKATAGAVATAAELTARLGNLAAAERDRHAAAGQAAVALAAASDARARADAAWRAQRASDLARLLNEGEACPVCGSTAHPMPHPPAAGDLPDPDRAVADENDRRAAHAARQDEARRAEDQYRRAADQLDNLRLAVPSGLSAEGARLAVGAAASEAAAAVRDKAALPVLAAASRAANDAVREALADVEGTEAALRLAQEAVSTERGAIAALRADAPAAAGGSAELARAASHLRVAAATEIERLDHQRREQAAAGAAVTGSDDTAQRERTRAGRAAEVVGAARAELERICRAAGFADSTAAQAARLLPEQIATLAAAAQAFDRERAKGEALAAQAAAAAAGLVAPDLAKVAGADQSARAASEDATRLAGGLAERHRQALDRLAAIQQAEAALAGARDRHTMLRDVADATGGHNDRRLSLEGFVLASILDEALAAANHHLGRMLGGRYRVRRREEPARANAAVGLEIEVLDEWTGQVRPAGTLSGGEGFCAALALALGLADTVQAHAGARRIDTLFIDEGFGSLDEDALDTAMDVLDGLQAGDRLVGIISHVAELRARIPAQLVVRPGIRGSTGGFVTPTR